MDLYIRFGENLLLTVRAYIDDPDTIRRSLRMVLLSVIREIAALPLPAFFTEFKHGIAIVDLADNRLIQQNAHVTR